MTMLVRIRTKDEPATLTLSNQPHGEEMRQEHICGTSLAALGITHGHMLYATYDTASPDDASLAQETSPPLDIKNRDVRPWESVQEDAVDIYWEKQPGTIPRSRDAQFCRHGEKGMCDYCMPLEPYDAGYHALKNIKSLSFHAYLRKQNIGVNAARTSTFVPPLEEESLKVKVPCPSGQHPPWPAGICTKCQPSALTLQRQPYRMVDHVELVHPCLIENMLDIWRKTNTQRFGFLIGRYEPFPDVPMGIKAVVEAIHEPSQQGELDGLTIGVPWEDQSAVEALAKECGLGIVGMIYTDLQAADPTHTDPTKAGLVACKRHADSFFFSGAEAIFAAQLQSANRSPSRFSRTGMFNSKFVTCVLSGSPEGVIDIAAYQVSEQAMSMVDADMIEASVEPTTVRVKPSTADRYMPQVFYRYKNKYNIDVKESAKPTFPVEYLLVNTTHGFPKTPAPLFYSHAFPIENRPGIHDQDMAKMLTDLAKVLGDVQLHPGSGSPQASHHSEQYRVRQDLVKFFSDWHLLAFLNKSGLVDQNDMRLLSRVATSHDLDAALDALLDTNGWHTLSALAREHAPQLSAPADVGMESTGAGNDAAAGGVACPHCTFINPSGTADCEVCGLPM
ncbi:Npl4p [Malassezia vespertilionis]|uniref:Nuclear protein localization protein 4 n=1 Tax=Malassezia vespertilionis TaxID=2020962 RepID=A0A2N1JHQ5_9BASI|nr:Npl4p [Malassezia vespertilionis]